LLVAILAAARVLGGHLVHVIVLVGWVLAVLVVLAWPRTDAEEGRSPRSVGATAPGARTDGDPGAAEPGHVVVAPTMLELLGLRRPARGPGGSSRRWEGQWLQGAALGAFAAAVVHLAVSPDHFRGSGRTGAFLLAAALAQIALGVLLLARPSRLVVVAAVAAGLGGISLWAWTAVAGVPIGPWHAAEATGLLGVVALAAESATVTCGVYALRGRPVVTAWRWSGWSGPMRTALLTTAAFMTVAVSAAPKG